APSYLFGGGRFPPLLARAGPPRLRPGLLDALPADLDHVHPRQDGEVRGGLRSLLDRRVAERSADEPSPQVREQAVLGPVRHHRAPSSRKVKMVNSSAWRSDDTASREPNSAIAQRRRRWSASSAIGFGRRENRTPVGWRSRNSRGLRGASHAAAISRRLLAAVDSSHRSPRSRALPSSG